MIEFPSVAAWEAFYFGPVYQGLKSIRDECSSARLVCVCLSLKPVHCATRARCFAANPSGSNQSMP
jgi:hypothetical protein